MSLEEERRALIDRKRNLLFLISQYLTDNGFHLTNATLLDETNLPNADYQICDNIDLDTIYMEFCSFYQMKFNKGPKIIKKLFKTTSELSSSSTSLDANGRKSANTRRRKLKQQQYNNNDNKLNENNEKLMEVNCITSSLSICQIVPPASDKSTSMGASINDSFDYNPFISRPPLVACEHYSLEWKEMADFICRDLIKKTPNIKWANVHGAETAKSVLNEGVLMPLEYPELFNNSIQPWKGVLLHGPPGTGKTLIAKALCSETIGKVAFFNIASSTVTSKWRGDSEKYIRVLFEIATFYAPSIIFIDEIEGLASRRDSPGEHEASKRFKNEFLTLIDGLNAATKGVFILCNTNLPWEIDSAFLRRFERKILIDLPNVNDRIEIIKYFLPNSNDWSNKQLLELSEIADGFTGDDIRIACKEVSMAQIRKVVRQNKNSEKSITSLSKILPDDLKEALKQIKPTSKLLVDKHKDWNKQFGSQISFM